MFGHKLVNEEMNVGFYDPVALEHPEKFGRLLIEMPSQDAVRVR